MKQTTVKNLMIPLKEYATVSHQATLKSAILELEKAQAEFCRINQERYKHRALLVYHEKHGHIIGKLSQLDVLKSLEPKYNEIAETGPMGRIATSGLNLKFLQSMLEDHALLTQSLDDMCKKAANLKVTDCMYIPTQGEFIKETDSMRMAIHQLMLGQHHSLLVLNDQDDISGILRLTDVFQAVCDKIKAI